MISALPSRHPKYRTKLCRNFANGNCPFGPKCSFLHPPPGVYPPPFSLTQYLVNGNALFASSTQQGAQEAIPRQSLPRSRGPQLIDEDPSPSTSLLLSTSGSTSSEQVPETRLFNEQKKYPCRHFVPTGGWCPTGAQCRFHHDIAALPSPNLVWRVEHVSSSRTDAYREEGRTVSGGVLMDMQPPFLPTASRQHLGSSRHTTAEFMQSYQPMYWSNYTSQPYRPYYVPVSVTAAPISAVQHGSHFPAQPEAQTMPSSETQTGLPLGAFEVNGTTYFPTSIPSVPVPAPMTHSFPVYPAPYDHPMAPVNLYHAPTISSLDIPNRTTNVCPQSSFDPFASDPMKISELPVVPRPQDDQKLALQHGVSSLLSSPSVLAGDLIITNIKDKPAVVKDSEQEFPYRPLEGQRVGHARRISVNVKKQGCANRG